MSKISDTIRRTETADGGIRLDIYHGQMFCLNLVVAKVHEGGSRCGRSVPR